MTLNERITVKIDRNKWARVVGKSFDEEGFTRTNTRDGLENRPEGKGPRLLNEQGNMCCLGFIAKALLQRGTLSEADINNMLLGRTMPALVIAYADNLLPKAVAEEVASRLKPLAYRLTDEAVVNASIAWHAVGLNDLQRTESVQGESQLSDQEILLLRETLLTEEFAKYGIDLVFEGEKDPVYEVPHCDTPGAVGTPDLRPAGEAPTDLQQ